jgi:hypothetical protein
MHCEHSSLAGAEIIDEALSPAVVAFAIFLARFSALPGLAARVCGQLAVTGPCC